jgi:ribose transport system substrate-binding protein
MISKLKVTTALGAVGVTGVILTASAGGSAGERSAVPSWCGPKKVTISLSDGFGGNTWRRITRAEFENEAAKCPSITKTIYTDGQANTQKAISDLNGLVAQGVNAMVVFPDAGKAILPALRAAYKQGVVTVPYRVTPGGKPGVDYTYFIPTNFFHDGVLWAEGLAQVLHGKGNVAYFGGPAGVSESTAKINGIKSVFKKYPGIHLIGEQPYVATGWDAATTQRKMVALLAKYPKVDGIIIDFGAASTFPAFTQAHRKLPAFASEDVNALGCLANKKHFGLVTVSSQNWHVRLALDWAAAKATGGRLPSQNHVTNYIFDNSAKGVIHCDPSLSPDAFLSAHLTKAQLKAALK